MNPLVSIIIPTFNRAHIIGETLDSVLAQTYKNWECIIVDDDSNDNTAEVLAKYITTDKRFHFYKRPTNLIKGASVCRNLGFEKSKGQYIQYLDSDDIMSNNKLAAQASILQSAPDYSIATCKWGRFSNVQKDGIIFENLSSYTSFESSELFLKSLANSKGYFPIHAYLIKRELVEKTGAWNEYLSLNDDGEFIMRLIVHLDKVFFTEKATVYYRFGNESNLSAYNQLQKCNDVINSYKMIDCLLKIRFKVSTIFYIEKMKDNLYINIKLHQPSLITVNKYFFENQIKYWSFKARVKRKINNILGSKKLN